MRPSAFSAFLLAAATAVPALAANDSGLPWPSGAKDGLDCLAQGRGRPVDVEHQHMGGTTATWGDQVTSAKGWVSNAIVNGPRTTLVSPWLLLSSGKGDFAGCAAGKYDAYWKQFGSAWAGAAAKYDANHPGVAKTVIVEPGWEANIGSGSHPWGVDDVSQVAAYKACFQHAAAALRSTYPGVVIAWTNAKRFRMNYTVAQMDPGVEDVYGLMYYDNYLPTNSQATWDKYVNSSSGTGGSPSGIGSWLAYAKAHGKKMGVSEWGIWDTSQITTAQADDPVYIDDMFRFFKANAAGIAYEAYQNNSTSSTDGHQLCPTTTFPHARDKYFADWKAG